MKTVKRRLPKLTSGISSRGAQFGRGSYQGHPAGTTVKAKVWCEPLDDGYDRGGAYWGLGQPVYMMQDKEDKLFASCRADHVEEAKKHFKLVFGEINIEFDELTT